MEIHQLRYFVAVADEGSFSRAAAKVRVAQPSLSQQIRKLEAEVGQPLFDRLPRSVVLTEAGRCLIDYARQILASIGDARRCVDELKSEIATIANMVAAAIGDSIVPQMMVKHQATPGCVSLPFAPPVPERELNLLYNPLRFQSKAAAAFRREAAAAFSLQDSSSARNPK